MDYSLEHHRSLVGSPISDLPTPAFIISKPVIEANIAQLHQDVEDVGVAFRPHVKTLKTLESTRMMLGSKHRKIIVSTIAEIRGALPLVKEGVLDEILYGLPINPTALRQLEEFRKKVDIVLMVDNDQHIALLESLEPSKPWPIFIKIDVGTKRAGIPTSSHRLPWLVVQALGSSAVSLYGFYCHAGHSYGCRDAESAEKALSSELQGVVDAAKLAPPDLPITLSIGSTPTAHVVRSLKAAVPSNVTLELHAGNFPTNDLQQLSTGLITESQLAIRVLVEVCSVYPERNEALVNAGTIALSKETSTFPGYGKVIEKPGWHVTRLSQEHGILTTEAKGVSATEEFRVGDKMTLRCSHACITASAFHVFYVVDEDDIVRETWVPWKGW